MATTSDTFDEQALATLPAAPAFVNALREKAFEEFLALPVPSQETEEWRYTDLSNFDLSFVPHIPGHGGPPTAAIAENTVTARPATSHGSSVAMTTSNQDLESQGVVFCDLDLAAEKYPDLVMPHLHSIVPTNRTKFTALHGAFRAGGTFLYVPADVAVALPLQTLTWLDADGTAIFPHTLVTVGDDADADDPCPAATAGATDEERARVVAVCIQVLLGFLRIAHKTDDELAARFVVQIQGAA